MNPLMNTRPNYFTIGLFVSAGLIIIVATLITLGVGAIWREHVYVESYIDESIQGIDVGSAVKMRGVQVGNVQRINFVNIRYPEATGPEQRYVMLEISLSLKAFGDITPEKLEMFLREEVQKGLRIRMQPMGLTGSAYMEMDYTDPRQHPPLPISWTPETPYIPSAPGTFARLEETFESMGSTMAKLEALDLDSTLKNLDHLLISLTATVESLDMQELTDHTRLFLEEMRQTNRKFSLIMGPERSFMDEEVSIYSIMGDTRAVVLDIRKGIERLKIDQDGGAMDQLAGTIDGMRLATEDMPETLKSIREAAESVQQSTVNFNRLNRSAYSLMHTQHEKIESIMRNLEITARNLMELSTDAKSYPSYILFGEKPLESEPK